MPITITVEDGSIVDDANSYVSVDDARAYALNRGVTLSDSDDTVGAQLIQAMDYFEVYRNKWKGVKVDPAQPLSWPRQNVILDDQNNVNSSGYDFSGGGIFLGNDYTDQSFIGYGTIGVTYFPATEIPPTLVAAQVQLVMAIFSGMTLLPNINTGLPVIKEVIGPIETTYARPDQSAGVDWNAVSLPTVDALLAPLLSQAAFSLRSVRV